MPTPVPLEFRTGRLVLRCWEMSDAKRLLPVLEANVDHLGTWIPAHVAEPAPLGELERRLAGFAADFVAARNWRYVMFTAGGGELVGEGSMFPRSATGRVELASADRVEIGYWLSRDATGKGYATEAARAMLDLATDLPGIRQVEIRCDPQNVPSAAVPRRLGFRLVSVDCPGDAASSEESGTMLWIYVSSEEPRT
jgi:RimJ/RimL family protein N-acetyltransferase